MRRFGLAALTIFGLALATGCAGDDKKTTGACTQDDECGAGVCFEQTCYAACTSTSVCETDQFCVRKDAGDRSVDSCVVAAQHQGCTDDADCGDLVAGACEAVSCDRDRGVCQVDALAGPGCGSQPDPDTSDVVGDEVVSLPDAPSGDTSTEDAPLGDPGAPADTAAPDQAVEDQAQADQSAPTDPHGFAIRVPQERTFACDTGADGLTNVSDWDSDWVCNVSPGSEQERFIYVQSTPTGCELTPPFAPIFETQGAWTSVGGTVTALTGAQYAWGADGLEANDSLSYVFGGSTYKLSHSSFDGDGKACQPMDCAQVWTENASAFLPLELVLASDGCTAARSLPVICREVKEDGSYDALTDTFFDCEGTPF